MAMVKLLFGILSAAVLLLLLPLLLVDPPSSHFTVLPVLTMGVDARKKRNPALELVGINPFRDKVPLNPGCIAREVSKYRPPAESERVYHHPSIIQYAKLAQSADVKTVTLTFMDYVAVMSAYKFLKPEKIMFHTYTDIAGKYWDIIRKWNTTIVINRVDRVVKLGTREVPQSLITHQADFVKLKGLLEFGGTISDFDVIIVNGPKWKQMQKSAECVLSREYSVINAGFNSCIKGSTFVQKWLDGYYTDYRTAWLWNASERPRHILENKNSTVCHDMLVVDGIATQPDWYRYAQWLHVNGVNWKNKVAAHYFDKKLKSFDETKVNASNSFGELLRYVLNS